MNQDLEFDFGRVERLGFAEAVFCHGKTVAQIERILDEVAEKQSSLLLTRLDEKQHGAIDATRRQQLDYDADSRTAFYGEVPDTSPDSGIVIVSAGTSDAPVASEAQRTLRFHGHEADVIGDIGVAGLWRLNSQLERLRQYRVIIVVAGMDGALPSVIGGLFGSVVIAVPTSTGYGVANGGDTALRAALTSCAPGIVVVNIDNGYGAAIAAMRAIAPGTGGG